MKIPIPPYTPARIWGQLDEAGALGHIIPIYRPFVVRCDQLLLDPENVRVHPADNVEATDASLERYLQRTPIVVNVNQEVFLRACRLSGTQPAGLLGVVEAGNSRLEIFRLRKHEWIAVAFVDDDLETHTGYAISDNRTAEMATWDIPKLLLQVERLEWKPAGIDEGYYAELKAIASGGNFDPLPPQGDGGDDAGGKRNDTVYVKVVCTNCDALRDITDAIKALLDEHPGWQGKITGAGAGGPGKDE